MRREDALRILRDHLTELRAMGVRSLSLFGSVAREQASETSDVDVLVELDRPATFDGFMDLKLRLEGWLGTRVDLVTLKSLRQRLRARIEAEAIRVA
jgi:predicted nucleotidyltransferase